MLLKAHELYLASVQIRQDGVLVGITSSPESALDLDAQTAESLQAFLADVGYIFHLEDE